MTRLPHPFDTIPFHRLSYAHPSPIHILPNLSQRANHISGSKNSTSNNINLWTKREDQAGPLTCYGNKYRKFEYIIPDILDQQGKHGHASLMLVTEGAIQSNHTVQVASLARILGLKCTVLLHKGIGGLRATENKDTFTTVGNVQLNRTLGANVIVTDEADTGDQNGPLLPVLDELKAAGETPYWISSGASLHPLGGLGYARCAFEIAEQEAGLARIGQLSGSGHFDYIFVACGSGSTLAGLIAGFKLLHKTNGNSSSADSDATKITAPHIVGIMTSPTKSCSYQEERILRLARSTGTLIGLNEDDITATDIHLDDGIVGEAYGILDKDTAQTLDLVARTDSLLLDPVYTGKVMRGMLHWAENGRLRAYDERQAEKSGPINALFIHTGGQNALNAYADVWPSNPI